MVSAHMPLQVVLRVSHFHCCSSLDGLMEQQVYKHWCLLHYICLQRFDTVGWASGRASGLWKM